MPNIKSAKKRVRQAEKNRQHNKHYMSGMRTCVKNVVKAVEENDKELAQDALKKAVPALDSAVNKGLIHRNKASRHKSRLNKAVLAM